jgi:hypothetical protein
MIEDIPADLIALDARCRIFEALGRADDLRRESGVIVAGLRHARWRLSSAAWGYHHEEAARWSGAPPLTETEQQALIRSRAAEWATQFGAQPVDPKGRRILVFENRPVLVSWMDALLVAPDRLDVLWRQAVPGPEIRAMLAAQVTYNGQTTNALQLMPGPAAPGIFPYTGSGFGQAPMLNQDNSYCTASKPAAKESWVAIVCDGRGPD